ncbi:hypothetical protein HYS91_05045 [Candidatus Daviesbacteria bacterium]|nr:hypothetical protein [Candidatus Daviesbacteria bacterium]
MNIETFRSKVSARVVEINTGATENLSLKGLGRVIGKERALGVAVTGLRVMAALSVLPGVAVFMADVHTARADSDCTGFERTYSEPADRDEDGNPDGTATILEQRIVCADGSTTTVYTEIGYIPNGQQNNTAPANNTEQGAQNEQQTQENFVVVRSPRGAVIPDADMVFRGNWQPDAPAVSAPCIETGTMGPDALDIANPDYNRVHHPEDPGRVNFTSFFPMANGHPNTVENAVSNLGVSLIWESEVAKEGPEALDYWRGAVARHEREFVRFSGPTRNRWDREHGLELQPTPDGHKVWRQYVRKGTLLDIKFSEGWVLLGDDCLVDFYQLGTENRRDMGHHNFIVRTPRDRDMWVTLMMPDEQGTVVEIQGLELSYVPAFKELNSVVQSLDAHQGIPGSPRVMISTLDMNSPEGRPHRYTFGVAESAGRGQAYEALFRNWRTN